MLPYFAGKVLNAGCGNGDIRPLAKSRANTSSLDNCDIASDLPVAIICNLSSIPLASEIYDTVLFNAVLEHVANADAVMAELRRVLRPGGYLIVAYHSCSHITLRRRTSAASREKACWPSRWITESLVLCRSTALHKPLADHLGCVRRKRRQVDKTPCLLSAVRVDTTE